MAEQPSTRKRLSLAFAKLKRDASRSGKPNPSISAVAREAGVSHTLIHTKYPDIAASIREASGRGPKQQLETQRSLVKQAKDRNGELRRENAELKRQNQELASENARLVLLVRTLQGEVASLQAGVVVLRPKRPVKKSPDEVS